MTVYPVRDFTAAPNSVKLARAMTDEARTGLLNRHGEGQVAHSLPEGSESTKSVTIRRSPRVTGLGRVGSFLPSARPAASRDRHHRHRPGAHTRGRGGTEWVCR